MPFGEFNYLVDNSIYLFTTHIGDENLPSFAVSTLVSSHWESTPPMRNALIFSLVTLNPKDVDKRGPPFQMTWCAERKAEVDTMRVETTFLWMSDPVWWTSSWAIGRHFIHWFADFSNIFRFINENYLDPSGNICFVCWLAKENPNPVSAIQPYWSA